MIRFIKESFKPVLKCRRLGHDLQLTEYEGLERSRVSDDMICGVYGALVSCRRCKTIVDRTVVRRDPPIRRWCDPLVKKIIDKEGFVKL